MRVIKYIFPILLFYSFASYAQPRYSPAVRADRETEWMTDSLHITPAQGLKVHTISLDYNKQMDKAAQLSAKQKAKTQKKLNTKKDAAIKSLLNKQQYNQYYKRELMMRALDQKTYNGTHQPM